ncbi:protein AGENET DOMAIN (AGD)-CONTAINING P1-like isoform X2 [Magnolia sinica]|uniref:protein AGENET DOMAIN (AGD)-CONTAINING P1-like isoform X2 n=1 Tax=Magnolia sinica TaxID=86752 RepID=UPI00265AF492|nr:protein AGENET DOMAIN (AGD)-CONTAINING P1-like isoform X2 [Magnolia sinica]
MAEEVKFSKGTEVEVRSEEPGFEGSWYTATVLRFRSTTGRVSVQYHSLMSEEDESKALTAVVDIAHVRPLPPVEAVAAFEPGDEVDAFYNDGWWDGTIKEAVGDSKYVVHFSRTGEEMEFGTSDLRHHLDWIDGKWVLKDKTVLQRKSETKFSDGMIVEVSSDEEGFCGAWFAAVIVNPTGKNSFLVEYQNLRTDDEAELLRETVDSKLIRPIPPDTSKVKSFARLEEVDAWYNEAWWVGVISKVLKGSKYIVYFRHSKEELEFQHSELRLHQDWINGRWVRASQV